jgi:hypothetical protein
MRDIPARAASARRDALSAANVLFTRCSDIGARVVSRLPFWKAGADLNPGGGFFDAVGDVGWRPIPPALDGPYLVYFVEQKRDCIYRQCHVVENEKE